MREDEEALHHRETLQFSITRDIQLSAGVSMDPHIYLHVKQSPVNVDAQLVATAMAKDQEMERAKRALNYRKEQLWGEMIPQCQKLHSIQDKMD